jgi:hypothetical protein
MKARAMSSNLCMVNPLQMSGLALRTDTALKLCCIRAPTICCIVVGKGIGRPLTRRKELVSWAMVVGTCWVTARATSHWARASSIVEERNVAASDWFLVTTTGANDLVAEPIHIADVHVRLTRVAVRDLDLGPISDAEGEHAMVAKRQPEARPFTREQMVVIDVFTIAPRSVIAGASRSQEWDGFLLGVQDMELYESRSSRR